ncbi:MAG: HipA N-terminal domain-containing protein [Bacteroidaceae bacterium]|nr:HipA N-terminal domain-containing protein [Bacteroidaceae bacterium]
MRSGNVYYNGVKAGTLTESTADGYHFSYDDAYLSDAAMPSISLTLPKTQKEYRSKTLFAFFFNMLSEGHNREAQSRMLKIDKDDHFGILLATAACDTPGGVTVKPIE